MMTPAEWERCLTFHYLRSDGPYGGSALTFLDATPAELAAAAVDYGLTEETAQAAFMAQFERYRVQAWLNGESTPPNHDDDVPGYFRYLVLTTLVSATEENVGNNNDFRDRLGALLGGGRLNSVAAVNNLWRALRDWTLRRQALGEPIRTVELPSPGNMKLIGCAVRLAFPAWRDRAVFAKVLRTLSREVRANPERLLQELSRPHRRHTLPAAVAGALGDFERQLRARRRMLLGHHFWSLVQSIDAQLCKETERHHAARWRFEVRFAGWDHDELEVQVSTRSSRSAAELLMFEGGFAQLMARIGELPDPLSDTMNSGSLLLNQTASASWAMDEAGPRDDAPGLVMTRDTSNIEAVVADPLWKDIGEAWWVSRKLGAAEVLAIAERLGLQRGSRVRLSDLSLEGGVRTGRGAWLGRPGLLPVAIAASDAELVVERLTGKGARVTVETDPPVWKLDVTEATDGRWKIIARESGVDTVKPLILEANAPERWTWPEPSDQRFEPESELATSGSRSSHLGARTSSGIKPARELPDLLEAIYAGASADGWSESELVPLLERRLPQRYFVWDFLRAVSEAGWIEPYSARGWRARRWRLRPPTFVRTQGATVVEGAVGASARARLDQVIHDLGGQVVESGRLSSWAPPLLRIIGVDASRLSEVLGWRLDAPCRPDFAAAPKCWPTETRTQRGRELNGLWSFELGLFLPPSMVSESEGVRLERWARERGDDRDLFLVREGEATFAATSRTAAILEAHRLARRPLFRWAGGRLLRLGSSGHLPLPVARALAQRAGAGSGPVQQADGSWSYGYLATSQDAAWLFERFGPVVAGLAPTASIDHLSMAIAARRGGRRPSWYSRPIWKSPE